MLLQGIHLLQWRRGGGDITYIQMEREGRGAIGDKEYSRNECEIFLMKGNEGKTGGYEGFQGV